MQLPSNFHPLQTGVLCSTLDHNMLFHVLPVIICHFSLSHKVRSTMKHASLNTAEISFRCRLSGLPF
ncbi:hypothetical protein JHK82_051017 [Glycine max]|uniref:Uncharacterized protein n=1 Tax=Glycine max TaxID=3847 RepID=A0A0R0F2K7_SOYBN|nr:hypothetical protein JHK85_051718 [Glycine max]KAG5092239.1 hypothetical protein JHK82_051017 [Glycine max]KAG5095317.1 hypothetical protein JHK84_050905 [Glycine max]